MSKKFGIAVHGGAGTILQQEMTPEKEAIYKGGLEEAINAGYRVLEAGGLAVDAVEQAVRCLEDFPYFNAGKGAVFNHTGEHEMDASIMNGFDLAAGAVSGVKHIRNPVSLAKEIMTDGTHVFLGGEGAEEFARERNLSFEEDSYFFSQERYDQWQHAIEKNVMQLDHGSEKKFGTVGAVALDKEGNLAAATSTGGITNKRFGRIGDSPMIGSGTYANNKTCAVSCTGHGEYFIRAVVAYDISALMEYKGMLLKEACEYVVQKKLVNMRAEGGLISIDRFCNIELSFNSDGMYRGYRKNHELPVIAIYRQPL
ncbi:MAG: isoaspartyl peptidase/L-asparaginase [Chitinophagaceae bacterium]|nr:isoaspartyl peptidase/L-asparaginase [Chitinophagaceae bacterium]